MKQLIIATKKSLCLSLLTALIACGGCSKEVVRDENTISAGEVVFVDNFPKELTLTELEDVSFDEIGISSLKMVDSILIIGHNNCWSFYSSSGKKYGDCLSVGQGPNEFLFIPSVPSCGFNTYNDSLYAYISTMPMGKIMRLNVTKFINDSVVDLRPQIEAKILKTQLWQVSPCDSSTFVMAVPNADYKGFTRQIYKNGEISEIPGTETLSDFILQGEDINLLAKIQRYNPKADMVLEAMSYLHQLNIYSPDGSRMKTICIGDKLNNIRDIENMAPADRPYFFRNAEAYPNGFGAIYMGTPVSAMDNGSAKISNLQFFDWDGKPKCSVVLPYQVYAMDIDFNNKRLYAIDLEEDRIRTYDASQIIDAMNVKQ